MPGAAVGSECTINPFDLGDDGPAPEVGDYLVSSAGTTYDILEVRQVKSSRHPRRFALRCLKVGHRADVWFDPDSRVFGIEWYGRGSR